MTLDALENLAFDFSFEQTRKAAPGETQWTRADVVLAFTAGYALACEGFDEPPARWMPAVAVPTWARVWIETHKGE